MLGFPVRAADRRFFELGGDSLSALRLVARLRLIAPRGGIGVADLLRDPTIAELAARIEAGPDSAEEGPAAVIRLSAGRAGSGRPLLVLFPGLLVSTRDYEPLVAHLGPGQEAHGFLCASLLEAVRPLPAVADLADAYAERVRTLMRGRAETCLFLGWSWGGVLAYETAGRLGPGFPWTGSGCSTPAVWNPPSPAAPAARSRPRSGPRTRRCWPPGSKARRCVRTGRPCAPAWIRKRRCSSCASWRPSRSRCPPTAPRSAAGSGSSGRWSTTRSSSGRSGWCRGRCRSAASWPRSPAPAACR
ncbi:phosphopantetheine-binding protein [Methylobacterium sp. P31]